MTIQSNSGRIMSLIREREIVHQTELARLLKIEKSTVSRIVKKLKTDGLLMNAGELPAGNAGGRKSILLKLNPKGVYAIGVELGVEKIVIALVTQNGSVVEKKKVLIPEDKSPGVVIPFLSQNIVEFLRQDTVKGLRVVGVGVALPGVIDTIKGAVISSFNINGWDNTPLAAQLSDKLELPVRIDNNVRMEAIGERCFGCCREIDDFLTISVHYGIGLGIFSGGHIFRGAHHQAGDIHISLDANGPKCSCGRQGCIEALAGAKVILKRYKNKGIFCIDDICSALVQEDCDIEKSLQESGVYIGQLVAQLTELFDPEKVILGGPLIHAGTVLFDAVQNSYIKHVHKDRWTIEKLEKSALRNDAAVIGAAVVAMDSLFECKF